MELMRRLVLMFVVCCCHLVSAQDNDDQSGSGDEENDCKVSEWSEWGSCVRHYPPCPHKGSGFHGARARVHRMGVTAGYDVGRVHMMQNVRTKTKVWEQREACTNSHSCPQNDLHQSLSGATPCENGLSDIYPCRNIDMTAFFNFDALSGGLKLKAWGSPGGSDVWGWTDPEDDQEYVLMTTTHGTSFVRITDPENPVVLGFLQTRTYRSIWRDVKVVGTWAFIGSEAYKHGMQIIDLRILRSMNSFKELKADVDYVEVGNTHNVVSNNDTQFIYLVGASSWQSEKACRGGLHMIDVHNPKEPKYVGCYDDDGYTHDAQCVIYKGPDQRYQSREICFNYNEDSLTIVDVTRKDRPGIISKIGYDGSQYTHQGWLTDDHKFILMDDELDEYKAKDKKQKHTRTLVWDVSKLMQPKLIKEFWAHEESIDHNQYIVGDLAYQSNYEAGLRIIHFNQSSWDMKEVAYFDVFPSRTTANFGGTWSNYPYFKSGIVPVSSVEFGLYLLKPNMAAINKEKTKSAPYGERVRSRVIVSAEDGGKCPHPVETKPCTPNSC